MLPIPPPPNPPVPNPGGTTRSVGRRGWGWSPPEPLPGPPAGGAGASATLNGASDRRAALSALLIAESRWVASATSVFPSRWNRELANPAPGIGSMPSLISDPARAPKVPKIKSAATATVTRRGQPAITGRRRRAVRSAWMARSSSPGPGRTAANNSPSPRSSRRAADTAAAQSGQSRACASSRSASAAVSPPATYAATCSWLQACSDMALLFPWERGRPGRSSRTGRKCIPCSPSAPCHADAVRPGRPHSQGVYPPAKSGGSRLRSIVGWVKRRFAAPTHRVGVLESPVPVWPVGRRPFGA